MELRESGWNREMEREKRATERKRARIMCRHVYVHCHFDSILLGISFTGLLQKINPESEKHGRLLEAACRLPSRDKFIKRKEGEVI